MAISNYPRYEFELVVTKFDDSRPFEKQIDGGEPVEIARQQSEWRKLTAIEVLEKIIEYLESR